MENLRYKMSDKQIITALECLSKQNSTPADREKCYFMWKEPSCLSCYHEVAQNALALINSQERKIKELTAENKLLNVELGNASSEILRLIDREKELTEENERLRAQKKVSEITEADLRFRNKELTAFNRRWAKECAELQDECDQIKADTVRKMLERITEHATNGYPRKVRLDVIYQIAKEMSEQ